MSELRFNDGVSFKTSGGYRVERRADGYYVVGRGTVCPVKDREDGEDFIKELMGDNK